MKLLLFTVSALKYLVLTNQDEGEMQLLPEEEEETLFGDAFLNTSEYEGYEEELFTPCDTTVPGFNSLGLVSIHIVVFVLSLVGNSVVIYVVCTMKKSRTEIYLLHLALADLLFCLTLPFWAVNVHHGWIFGSFLCKLLSGFQEASLYCSVFLLVCISVDRYLAIVRATLAVSSHHLLVKVVCGIVWLIAALLSLPAVITRESMHAEDLGQFICYENLTGESSDRWRVSMRVVWHSVGFFLPLVVMAVCYSWTAVKLFGMRNQKKHKAMCVILAVVLAFILCWLPYNLTVLIDTLARGGSLPVGTCETHYRVEVALKLTQLLAFSHCAVNPLLYAFIGERFRKQLMSAFSKHGCFGQRPLMKKSSVNSAASSRTRITSAIM